MKRKRLLVVAGLLVMLASAGLFIALSRQGIRVTIINSGPDPLTNVVVHVTGNQHAIGNLAAGESRTVRVLPTSESHAEVSFVDHRGQHQRLNAGGYFENGLYRGTIEVEIERGAIKRNEHNIGLSFF